MPTSGKTYATIGAAEKLVVACPDGNAFVRRMPNRGRASGSTTDGRARLKMGFRTLEESWSPAAMVRASTNRPSAPRRPLVRKRIPIRTKMGIRYGPGSVRNFMMGSSHGWCSPRWMARKIARSHASHTTPAA